MSEYLQSFNKPFDNRSDESLTYDEELDDLFNEVVGKIKTGETVLFPRVEDPSIVDIFKYKKYQGCVQLVDSENSLYRAYRLNPNEPNSEHQMISNLVNFDIATEAIINLVTED